MKKILMLLIATLLITSSYAANKTNTASQTAQNVKEAVSTTHQDIRDVVTTVHEDAKGVITTVYGDGKGLAKDLYPEVKSAVIQIAKGIGVAAEHLYSVLVKKYVVDGLVQAIPFLTGLIVLIIGWVKTERYCKSHEKIDWHILYPSLLIFFGIIFLGIVDYNTMFMGLINPEFGAINYILDFTKDMIK